MTIVTSKSKWIFVAEHRHCLNTIKLDKKNSPPSDVLNNCLYKKSKPMEQRIYQIWKRFIDIMRVKDSFRYITLDTCSTIRCFSSSQQSSLDIYFFHIFFYLFLESKQICLKEGMRQLKLRPKLAKNKRKASWKF